MRCWAAMTTKGMPAVALDLEKRLALFQRHGSLRARIADAQRGIRVHLDLRPVGQRQRLVTAQCGGISMLGRLREIGRCGHTDHDDRGGHRGTARPSHPVYLPGYRFCRDEKIATH